MPSSPARDAPASTRARRGASNRSAAPAAAASVSPRRSAPARIRRSRSTSQRGRAACARRSLSRSSFARRLGRVRGRRGEPLRLVGQLARLALDLVALRLVDVEQPDLALAAEAHACQLGGAGALVRCRRRRPRLVLERAHARELGREHACTLRARVCPDAQRLLEPRRDADGGQQSLVEPFGTGEEPPEQGRIGGARASEMCDLRVGGFGLLGRRGGLRGDSVRDLRLRLQLLDLGCELPPPGLELEQDSLGGFAREPELAAWRVDSRSPRAVTEGTVCRQQPAERDDWQLGDALGGALADEHGEAAKAGVPRAPEQRQAGGCVLGDDGRRASAERGRDCPLRAGRDIEEREGELGSLVGEHPRCRRDSFALRERALESRKPLLGDRGTLGEVVARMRGGAGGRRRLVRGGLELSRCRAWTPRRCLRLGELDPHALSQCRDGLGAHREPLARRPEPVESRGRTFTAAGCVGQLGLQRLPLPAQPLEPILGARRCRTLERREPFLRRPGALGCGAARSSGGPRGGRRRCRRPLQLARRLVRDLVRGCLGLAELAAQLRQQALRSLLPQRDPLGRALRAGRAP